MTRREFLAAAREVLTPAEFADALHKAAEKTGVGYIIEDLEGGLKVPDARNRSVKGLGPEAALALLARLAWEITP
jgi:hypothetical protein